MLGRTFSLLINRERKREKETSLLKMLACVPSPVKDASEQNADVLTCVGEKSSLDEVLAFALSKINLEDGGNISGDCVQVLL